MTFAAWAVLGGKIREQRVAYRNYLLSLEPKKQKLINNEYRKDAIEELMREDPRGILAVLHEETLSERISRDKEKEIWRTAFNMLPQLNRHDLVAEAESYMYHLYLEHFGTIGEYFRFLGRCSLEGLKFWGGDFSRINHRFAVKYLRENQIS